MMFRLSNSSLSFFVVSCLMVCEWRPAAGFVNVKPLKSLGTTTTNSGIGFKSTRSSTPRRNLLNSGFPGRNGRSFLLHEGKNSDRAFIERNLEQAMDNDWRVFRAKLVAQEKAEQRERGNRHTPPHPHSTFGATGNHPNSQVPHHVVEMPSHHAANYHHHAVDPKLARQGQIGDLFAGAINSIFKSHPSQPSSLSPHQRLQQAQNGYRPSAFGHSRYSEMFPSSSVGAANNILSSTEDPFVSEAELPLLMEPKVSIDKHRWAHEIPHIEPGCVLVANEKLGGVFHQTVVLIIEHHESTGTFGVVINRPMDGDLLKIGAEPNSKIDLSLKMAFSRSQVSYGGPVLTDEFSVLHSYGEVEGARKLCPGVYIGGSDELMNAVRMNRLDPREALFLKGHAAWVPGQLQREIQKGVWYTAAASSDFILRYANNPPKQSNGVNDLWADILNCMGDKFEEIARRFGGAGDSRRMMP